MFCKNCGTELKENSKFCSKCGAEFHQEKSVKRSISEPTSLLRYGSLILCILNIFLPFIKLFTIPIADTALSYYNINMDTNFSFFSAIKLLLFSVDYSPSYGFIATISFSVICTALSIYGAIKAFKNLKSDNSMQFYSCILFNNIFSALNLIVPFFIVYVCKEELGSVFDFTTLFYIWVVFVLINSIYALSNCRQENGKIKLALFSKTKRMNFIIFIIISTFLMFIPIVYKFIVDYDNPLLYYTYFCLISIATKFYLLYYSFVCKMKFSIITCLIISFPKSISNIILDIKYGEYVELILFAIFPILIVIITKSISKIKISLKFKLLICTLVLPFIASFFSTLCYTIHCFAGGLLRNNPYYYYSKHYMEVLSVLISGFISWILLMIFIKKNYKLKENA